MKTIRNTLRGASVAQPLFASAGMAQTTPPAGSHVIYVPPGATIVILPGPGNVAAPNVVNAGAPEAMPMMRLIVQQQAAMRQMFADMNAMFPPMPDPNAMLRAAFGPGGPFNVSVTPLAGGHGVCSQSISIVAGGNGSAPIVHVSQTGDACGAMGIGKPQHTDQVRPEAPAPLPHGPNELEIGYAPHPLTTATPPRT